MTIDPEERKRQRQACAQQRARQAAQRRKVVFGIGAAVVVLIVCGILIFALAGKEDPGQTTDPSPNLQETTDAQTEATEPPVSTVHFVAGGDLNVGDAVVASGGTDYDYTDTFLDVAAILAQGDLTTLNLEGSLYGAPYGSQTASAPLSMAQALRRAGVDTLQLANSYAINQGMSGLKATIEAVRSAGMEPLGVYADQTARKQGQGFTVRTVNGVKIALVAFTKGMGGTRLPTGSEGCVNVLYSDYDSTYQTVDTQGITSVLQAVQKEKPDITIALLHWGSEFNDTISSSQKKIVSLMQENGVDAIIGTHSHYVQKMEYNEEDGTFVAYCLGDFLGDAQRAGSEYSVLLDLEITKDNQSGKTKITGYSYTPIFTVAEAEKPLRVVRIREAMAAYEQGFVDRVSPETYAAMEYALGRIESRIAGNG